MAEVMAVEAIIDAYWQLQGFWTKSRFAFQTAGRGWSDVDVLAYHPKNQQLVIAELKVQGVKKAIWVFAPEIEEDPTKSFSAFEGAGYFGFVDRIPEVCS